MFPHHASQKVPGGVCGPETFCSMGPFSEVSAIPRNPESPGRRGFREPASALPWTAEGTGQILFIPCSPMLTYVTHAYCTHSGSSTMLTRAHLCSSVLTGVTCARPCSCVTRAHPCSPMLICAHLCHPFSPVLTYAHLCSPVSLVLTRAHPCSLVLTCDHLCHPCSPVSPMLTCVTRAHLCSPMLTCVTHAHLCSVPSNSPLQSESWSPFLYEVDRALGSSNTLSSCPTQGTFALRI